MGKMLSIAVIGGPAYDPLYRELDKFQQQTGIKVNIGFKGSHPELNQHLRNRHESGSVGYDLVSTHTKYAPSQSFLMPLDSLFSKFELDELNPMLRELATIGGQLMSFPRNVDVRLLYYRSDWFEELGLQYPFTWEQLVQVSQKLRKAGRFGFVFTGRESGLFGTFYELLTSAGGELFDEQLQPAFDSNAGEWGLSLLRQLFEEGLVPKELPSFHYDEASSFFRDGHCAMVTDWPGYYSLYAGAESKIAERFDLAPLPAGPTGKTAVYGGSHSFGIPCDCKEKEAAAELLRFLVSEEVQSVDAEHGHIPVRPKLLQSMKQSSSSGTIEMKRWDALEKTLRDFVIIPPKFQEYPDVEEKLWQFMQKGITGELSVKNSLRAAYDEISRLVSRYRKP
ncbi:carbohydrate ABC transporter substrate-binding protein, CUT1 family [Paenibacillus sp. yr247]|uniref:ABC transporter substrate-binding protein n=1 Tax=Paenibacillus sp. yr247 TaxID=1761880 RepID=UPI000883743B|nr:extracellular solute-binding protein [Paenibacillus sp. yr247]SDO35489.1 carbohydrate ABC transporter substrate-binding protein, CUT1 family [Paenibacillus sp. yr247]